MAMNELLWGQKGPVKKPKPLPVRAPYNGRERKSIIQNVLHACEDITNLHGRAYGYLSDCIGFSNRFHLFGFVAYYSTSDISLAESILLHRELNTRVDTDPADPEYDYCISRVVIYTAICDALEMRRSMEAAIKKQELKATARAQVLYVEVEVPTERHGIVCGRVNYEVNIPVSVDIVGCRDVPKEDGTTTYWRGISFYTDEQQTAMRAFLFQHAPVLK